MTQMSLQQASELAQTIQEQIGMAVIGQQRVIQEILIALIAGGNVLIEGVPGLGKTLLVRSLAASFHGSFNRIQFTPDLMPADITGHTLYDMNSKQFSVRKGPVFTHLLLADEINRAPAKTQAALLEVMQERQVTIDGQGHKVPLPFMTLATQNPLEQEGTYPLPEAQLDRFLMKIHIDYPGAEDEIRMVETVSRGQTDDQLNLSAVKQVTQPEMILGMQMLAAAIETDPAVIDYAVRITRATRGWPGISIGAGPRGSLSLIRAARAEALLDGRHYITPDDIKAVVHPVLRHRIGLAPEMELEGYGPDTLLKSILEQTDAPRR